MDTGTAGAGTDFHTGAKHFGKFGTTSTPVPDTSVSSVRYQYRHRALRYDIHTGTGRTGTVPNTPSENRREG